MDPDSKGGVPPKILLADDDPVIRKVVTEFFSGRGFAVVAVGDGVEACRAAEAEPPQLVLVDLLLPRRDGYAVLLHLRSRPKLRETPVLVLSGEPAGEQSRIGQALGIQGYIEKPLSLQKLDQAVREALSAAREGGAAR